MRQLSFLLSIAIIFTFMIPTTNSHPNDEEISVIVQVESDSLKWKSQIERDYPFINVVAIFDTLFNGLAIKATPKDLRNLVSETFITATFQVHTYKAIEFSQTSDINQANLPEKVNPTPYTGKGTKVAVIDTGIDYTHPDLAVNFQGGYDLVQLDNDPMETLPNEGIPTSHGTHVAGIIAANGHLKGVAKDAEIFAYRALGPGGQGTTIQVMAALEQAVKDGVDIINLSLGNSVNGPDFPTSIAVNKATDLGVAVVIANGNSGPEEWTVGSPATAHKALSVGAKQSEGLIPHLYDQLERKYIPLQQAQASTPWDLTKDYEMVMANTEGVNLKDKIALIPEITEHIFDYIKRAQDGGAVAVVMTIEGEEQLLAELNLEITEFPIAFIAGEHIEWLVDKIKPNKYFINTHYKSSRSSVAAFSSKGPVTSDWSIKPDVIAPGTNILSTVPGGYDAFDGTSMAAPHVSGALAIIKEANPHWTMEQIIQSLKTTARPLVDERDKKLAPIIQGMGEIDIQSAITAKYLINEPLLSFGKVTNYKENQQLDIIIENLSSEQLKVTPAQPKWKKGIAWTIPKTFTVEANSKKTVPIQIHFTTPLLEEGIHQGWVSMLIGSETIELPYLFINQRDDYPKATGLSFALQPFSKNTYVYQLYATEPIDTLQVELYEHNTFLHETTLLHLTDVEQGLNEGEIPNNAKIPKGEYYAIITVLTEDGTTESYVTTLVF